MPGPGHGAVQRGGHQRGPVRARQLPRLQAQPAPVDDADHRVCRPAGRRPRPRGLAREGQDHAAQLDRPQPGCPGVLPRRWARTRRSRSSPPARTRCSAPPSWCWRRSTRWWTSIVPQGDWSAGTKDAWTGGAATPEEAVAAYRLAASRKSEVERQTEGKDKTGVFTGAFATNPVNGEQIPVFVADYVLMGYGTGAIMAVPGQDERDWEFATRFELPIIRTVQPAVGHPEDEAYTGEGPAINSANDEVSLNGLGVAEAKARDHRLAGGQGPRRGDRQLQAARLAVQPAALLGRAVPDRLRRGAATATRCPTRCCPSTLPDVPGLLAARRSSPRTPAVEPGAAAVAGARVGRGRARPG